MRLVVNADRMAGQGVPRYGVCSDQRYICGRDTPNGDVMRVKCFSRHPRIALRNQSRPLFCVCARVCVLGSCKASRATFGSRTWDWDWDWDRDLGQADERTHKAAQEQTQKTNKREDRSAAGVGVVNQAVLYRVKKDVRWVGLWVGADAK